MPTPLTSSVATGHRRGTGAGGVLHAVAAGAQAAAAATRPFREDLTRAWEKRFLGYVRDREPARRTTERSDT
jgi:hypothetical protein